MKIIKRLFGFRNTRQDHGRLSADTAQRVVNEYAMFMEDSAPLPGRVADAADLPHEKETIKAALATCIAKSSDPVLVEHLRHGYLMLSAWQDGVGDTPIGVDYTQLDLGADPMDVAEEIQRCADLMKAWTPLIDAEQETLTRELNAMGAYLSQTGT